MGGRRSRAEVSDAIHLRRFCRISLGEWVPDEATVRKLTRRIGSDTVEGLTRSLIESAVREKRFRPRAVRIDSTVIEAEGRISHLKRGYGLGRSRLKGDQGRQVWTGWSILAYNADTLAVRAR